MRKFLLSVLGLGALLTASAEQRTITLAIADDSSNNYANWTVIDGYDDSKTWQFKGDLAEITSSSATSDEWLISPGVELVGGVTYSVTANMKYGDYAMDTNKVAVGAGNDKTAEAMTVIFSNESLSFSTWTKDYECGTFKPSQSGTYYFGVRLYTNGWGSGQFSKFVITGDESNVGGGEEEDNGFLNVPYNEDFSKDPEFAKFHSGASSDDWAYYSSSMRYCNDSYNISDAEAPGNYVDAYAVSPGINLKKGKAYQLAFDAWINNNNSTTSYKPLYVRLGSGENADAFDDSYIFYELIENKDTPATAKKKACIFSVPSDGVYYLGFNVKGKANSNYVYIDNLALTEVEIVPLGVSDLTVTPGENGANSATLTWKNPSTDNAGGSLNAISKIVIKRDDTEIKTLTDGLTLGAEMSYVDNDPALTSGKHVYNLTVYVGDAASDETVVTSPWIGKDTAVGKVGNLTATVVDDNTISLNFDVPVGSNGGYVDPADITYKITRSPAGGSAETLETAYSGPLPYQDTNVPGLNRYTYYVYPIYNGNEGTYSYVEIVSSGAVNIPYSQDFSTNAHFFTFIHGEGVTRDWTWSSSRLGFFTNTTDNYQADAYAVSPAINLEVGKAYGLTFDTQLYSTAKPLLVMIGKEATIEGLTTEIFNQTIEEKSQTKRETIFSVPESGRYHIAFVCKGDFKDYNDIYVDNVKVDEVAVVPNAVSDLTAEAGANGALEVALSWTNPSATNAGTTLSAITKVVINRGETEVATVTTGLTPGEQASYTDKSIEADGSYTYTLTVYVDEAASEAASVTVPWVGVDAPKAPENVALNVEGTVATISWDAVTEGQNGGYFDATTVKYKVVRMPDEAVVAEETDATTVTDNVAGLPLARYFYEISVVGYDDVKAATEKATLGDALELPYTPDMSKEDTYELWTLTNGGSGNGLWEYSSIMGALRVYYKSNKPWAFTPPFKAGKGKYKIELAASCYNSRYPETFEVYLAKAPTHEDENLQLIQEVTVNTSNRTSLDAIEFEVLESGVYYIGYKYTTVDYYILYIYQSDISLVEAYEDPAVAPKAAEDFLAVAAEEGLMQVNLSWTNPTEDVEDGELAEITKAVIMRGEELVATIETGLTPGEQTSYTDETLTEAGVYTYTLTLYCDEEASEAASAVTTWVGPDTHAAVENVKAELDVEAAVVKLTWDPVTTGINGGWVDTDAITYDVTRRHSEAAEFDHTVVTATPLTSATDDSVKELEKGTYVYQVIITDMPHTAGQGTYSHSVDLGVTSVTVGNSSLSYNRATALLSYSGNDALVYTADGTLVARGDADDALLDLASLPGGVYIARCGDAVLKFVK